MSAASFWAAVKNGALHARPPRHGHQIRVTPLPGGSGLTAVSCDCLRVPLDGPARFEPIEARTRWGPGEPAAVWRGHMEAGAT